MEIKWCRDCGNTYGPSATLPSAECPACGSKLVNPADIFSALEEMMEDVEVALDPEVLGAQSAETREYVTTRFGQWRQYRPLVS